MRAKVSEKGNDLKYIIAPDTEHHLFITDWADAYPQARVVGPSGLPEKRAHAGKPARFDTVLGPDAMSVGPDFDRDIECEYVGAHPSHEIVLLHKPDRTLIVADYMFDAPPREQYSRTGEAPNAGILSKVFQMFLSAQGTALAQRRMQWYALSRGDRDGYAKSARRVAGWDFDRIIPCHGDVIEGNGKSMFKKVFGWHLTGKVDSGW